MELGGGKKDEFDNNLRNSTLLNT